MPSTFLLSALRFDVHASPVVAMTLPSGYEWFVIGAIGLLIGAT